MFLLIVKINHSTQQALKRYDSLRLDMKMFKLQLVLNSMLKRLLYLPTKLILGVDIFFTAMLAGTVVALLLHVALRSTLAEGVRIFTAEDATEEFTPLLLVAIFEEAAVGLEADADVADVAWVTTFGSVEGMGLPSFVCSLTT